MEVKMPATIGNQNRRKYPICVEDAFIEFAIKSQTDECIIWPYGVSGSYPCISRNDKQMKVTRLICEQINGPAPSDKHEAAHNCGKGKLRCINGKHLRWDTHKGNQLDRLLHGTDSRGEKYGAAKLKEFQILEIRNLAGTMFQREIAKIYGISQSHVKDIINRNKWSWL